MSDLFADDLTKFVSENVVGQPLLDEVYCGNLFNPVLSGNNLLLTFNQPTVHNHRD
jgi:hypothetical protein